MSGNPITDPVTARIIFTGVMMTCINKRAQYEVGMVRCPSHEPTITVLQLEGGSVSKDSVNWPKGHDLLFKVIDPDQDGVSVYPTNDPDMTFGRVIDMEGEDLHRDGVIVNTSLLQGRRLAVTAGKLYTHRLTDVDFTLLTWTSMNAPGNKVKYIGKIARDVGLNILCRNEADSGIHILDLTTGEIIRKLPASANKTYQILIDNDCRKTGSVLPEGTDFRYFYDQELVRSDDGKKFDLGYEVSNEAPLASPDACENTFLSQTNTLGIGT